MEKVIKPSPVMMLAFGLVAAVTGGIIALDAGTGGTPEDNLVLVCIGASICFIVYLIIFIFKKRIKFDFDTFTVRGNTYRFSQISDVVIGYRLSVNPHYRRRRLRIISREQTIRVYVHGESVFSFTKDDIGADDFIALLKKHRIKFTVRNSLKDWKGVIE